METIQHKVQINYYGDFQFNIGGVNYPQKSLSTLNNKGGLMMELRRAMGSILNNNVSLSVNYNEFTIIDGGATTAVKPAKFWVAQNLQKLTVNQKAFYWCIYSTRTNQFKY